MAHVRLISSHTQIAVERYELLGRLEPVEIGSDQIVQH